MPQRMKGLSLEGTVQEPILFLTTSVNGTRFPALSWVQTPVHTKRKVTMAGVIYPFSVSEHALTRPSIGTLHSTLLSSQLDSLSTFS